MKVIQIGEERYPYLLRHIYNPPQKLYAVGNVSLLQDSNSIAIIGSRNYTEYGKNAALYFSYNLAKQGLTIVSGLAKGIDGFAHLGALAAKGKTIAVIGSGLDNMYPKENIELAREIVRDGGLVITEYPFGKRPTKETFPQRNRIISGLSKGVLIVEACQRSGALITADCALEQGRDVYAVPGSLYSKNSEGTNGLIKQGARLVKNYKEILQLYYI